jgi:organic hydroperoxide reductase OsmC/OhrA
VELDGGVLVVRRIHVKLRIAAPEDKRAAIERVHGFYADSCPLYRSVKAAIAVTTGFELASP